jgi:hypothetical protein
LAATTVVSAHGTKTEARTGPRPVKLWWMTSAIPMPSSNSADTVVNAMKPVTVSALRKRSSPRMV